jgi:hypothetical protein
MRRPSLSLFFDVEPTPAFATPQFPANLSPLSYISFSSRQPRCLLVQLLAQRGSAEVAERGYDCKQHLNYCQGARRHFPGPAEQRSGPRYSQRDGPGASDRMIRARHRRRLRCCVSFTTQRFRRGSGFERGQDLRFGG